MPLVSVLPLIDLAGDQGLYSESQQPTQLAVGRGDLLWAPDRVVTDWTIELASDSRRGVRPRIRLGHALIRTFTRLVAT